MLQFLGEMDMYVAQSQHIRANTTKSNQIIMKKELKEFNAELMVLSESGKPENVVYRNKTRPKFICERDKGGYTSIDEFGCATSHFASGSSKRSNQFDLLIEIIVQNPPCIVDEEFDELYIHKDIVSKMMVQHADRCAKMRVPLEPNIEEALQSAQINTEE